MPSKTRAQQKLAGIALAIKRGETPKSYSPAAAKMAASMSVKQLREFAGEVTKKKN